METEVRLTKLAGCAGCGAKVGAGTLVSLLNGFRTRTDPNLIVGYDRSDDASVYVVSEHQAIVQTTDFFPDGCDNAAKPVCSDMRHGIEKDFFRSSVGDKSFQNCMQPGGFDAAGQFSV